MRTARKLAAAKSENNMVAPNENGGDGGNKSYQLVDREEGIRIENVRIEVQRVIFDCMERVGPLIGELQLIRGLFTAGCGCAVTAAQFIDDWNKLAALYLAVEEPYEALEATGFISMHCLNLITCRNKCVFEHATGNCAWNRTPPTE